LDAVLRVAYGLNVLAEIPVRNPRRAFLTSRVHVVPAPVNGGAAKRKPGAKPPSDFSDNLDGRGRDIQSDEASAPESVLADGNFEVLFDKLLLLLW
jgi:hypothetical protein